MKELNKIMYDILLKIESKKSNDKKFKINEQLLQKYFNFSDKKMIMKKTFYDYFVSFFNYCFAKTSNNMVKIH